MVSPYLIALFLHIAGAIGIWITLGIWLFGLAALRRARRVEQVRALAWLIVVATPPMLLSLALLSVAGLYMTLTAWHVQTSGVIVSLVSMLAIGPIGAFVLDPPRLRRYDFQILDADQFQRFLQVIRGDRFEALYILALSTGMREGECLALRWADLDLAHNALQVKLTVSETDDNRFTLAEPKTLYSRRRVLLTPLAVEAIQEHYERQQVERANMGDQWVDNDLVFPNGFGGIMIPHNITKRGFKRLLAKAGLSTTLRFHDLRHTAATLLIAAGVPVKVVSEMLGHSSVTITLTTYAHVLPHMQQAAVDVMSGLLGSHNTGKFELIAG